MTDDSTRSFPSLPDLNYHDVLGLAVDDPNLSSIDWNEPLHFDQIDWPQLSNFAHLDHNPPAQSELNEDARPIQALDGGTQEELCKRIETLELRWVLDSMFHCASNSCHRLNDQTRYVYNTSEISRLTSSRRLEDLRQWAARMEKWAAYIGSVLQALDESFQSLRDRFMRR